MSNPVTIHKYEIATTARLSYDEKEALVKFLAELSRQRERFMGAVPSRTHGGFVLNTRDEHILQNVSTEIVRELAGNYNNEPSTRVVGYIEGGI